MRIIIDGYNLIRQSDFFRHHEKQSLEAGRQALIYRLAEYKKNKGHDITVVFDGWEGGEAKEARDREKNINIIYSRRGEKADEVIKRLADHCPEETIIVSSDREIISYVNRRGITVFTSTEFERLMVTAVDKPAVVGYPDEKDSAEETTVPLSKKGPAKRLPRAKRQKQIKIKKL